MILENNGIRYETSRDNAKVGNSVLVTFKKQLEIKEVSTVYGMMVQLEDGTGVFHLDYILLNRI